MAKKEAPAKKPTGRPVTYDKKVADDICERIAMGTPLAEICRDEGMPKRRTIYDWISQDEKLAAHFAHAREAGWDEIAEECLAIADDISKDTIITEFGPRPDKEWIARSRLRVDTRLKLLAKWNPKKYGDKLDVTTGGEAINTILYLPEKK